MDEPKFTQHANGRLSGGGALRDAALADVLVKPIQEAVNRINAIASVEDQ